MKFQPTSLEGLWLIEPELIRDERGAFARVFCADEFATHGLDPQIAQCSVSYNRLVGTLRGLHYQAAPFAEVKVVRVQRGAIWDVAVDLRTDSPTFSKWHGTPLTADNSCALYIPKGFAHGFITLEKNTEVLYQMSAPYVPRLARGLRWNDPTTAIVWPSTPTVISDKDRALPFLQEIKHD